MNDKIQPPIIIYGYVTATEGLASVCHDAHDHVSIECRKSRHKQGAELKPYRVKITIEEVK